MRLVLLLLTTSCVGSTVSEPPTCEAEHALAFGDDVACVDREIQLAGYACDIAERTAADSPAGIIVPPCDVHGRTPCWYIGQQVAACAALGGRAVVIERGGTEPPSGTTLIGDCRACE